MKYCSTCNEKFDDSISFCPKDGEVLEDDPSSLIGSILDGQYQIEGVLGKGGMGAVYRARHILLGDRVAIKVLPPEMRSNTEWLRRFQREGQAARRFRHPNAVTVYDLRTSADGTIYLVMEYVEGTTLDVELKKRGKFSPAEALTVLDPIMSVLNAAHAMGVVHRDLKPENIMIGKPTPTGEPVVKLLDLGIAKLREVAGAEKTGSTNLTIAGQMLGTPYYMSPEQWGELPNDGSAEIDGRADIYSLGVVFYELIAGKRPFTGMTLSELRRQHVSVTPKTLHEVDASVPEGFSKAIARAIAKDRSDRQGTANQLKEELTAALTAEGIQPASFTPSLQTTPIVSTATSSSEQKGKLTAAERTAATIVGESIQTGIENPDQQLLSSQASTMPTVVAGAKVDRDEESIVVPYQPVAPPPTPVGVRASQPVAGSKSRMLLVFIGAGVLLLVLVIAIGGFVLFYFKGKPSTADPSHNSDTSTGLKGSEPAATHEVARYWLEVNANGSSRTMRADSPITMQSGQSFKFHFSPSENGYIYIVGPGDQNVPTTFLNDKPSKDSGLKTNEVKSGLDFIFPADNGGKEHWITLDQTAGTDEWVIFFSPTPLTQPPFLTAPVGHELTPEEQSQLVALRQKSEAGSVTTEVNKTNGASPFVSVTIPQNAQEGASVIFRMRIEHR